MTGHGTRNNFGMQLNTNSASSSSTNIDPIEDLNRTLYDIGAQDLLDVWEAMEAQDEPSWTSSTASKDLCDSLNGLIHTPVLKDRLLTDSMLQTNGVVSTDEFPVSAEHSYSLGGSATSRTNSTFGSDGDSMPESPLSLDDDMETECYPCIPMHSASNQKRMNHSTVTMIKQEPLSEDVNVVDDHVQHHTDTMHHHHEVENRSLLNPNFLNKSSKTKKKTGYPAPASTSSAAKLQQHQQHTVRLSRPKHPQSLLKQKPVTHTILVTSSSSGLSKASEVTSATSRMTSADLVKSDPHVSLISNQPTDGCGVLILTEEEKKTLISEGYPIPSKLPLTKAEEKSLKKIRRKIKNKISAQESRRKKKEFVDTLERKVELAVQELEEYKKKCDVLQKQNTTLKSQLKNLKNMVANNNSQNSDCSLSATGSSSSSFLSSTDTDLDLD